MTWIGVNLNDLHDLNIPSLLIPSTDSNISEHDSLKDKSYIEDDDYLFMHITSMISFKMKDEIESMYNEGMKALSGYICSGVDECITKANSTA